MKQYLTNLFVNGFFASFIVPTFIRNYFLFLYSLGGAVFHKPIIVGNRTWIGANVILLPGAIVGDGCVIAAGSVVKGILEKDYLYAGNPAIPIKKLD